MNPVSAVPVVRRAYRSCAAEAVRSGQVRSERQPQSAAKGRRMPKSRIRYPGPEGRFPHYTAVSVVRRAYRSCAAEAVLSGPKGNRSLPQRACGCRSRGYAIRGRRGGFRTTRLCRRRRRRSAFRGAGSARPESPVRLEMPAASKSLLLRKACRRGNPRRNGDPRRRAGPVRGRDRLFRNSLPAVCPYEWRRYNPRR